MALTYSTSSVLGSVAADFSLPGTDGRTYRLSDFNSAKGLLIAFICNHCPYVKAVQGRMNALAQEFAPQGVAFVGINSNDAVKYPEDSFEGMKATAAEKGYAFPYLFDETQSVARAYGAVCTPEFYLYERAREGFLLRYRGRLDDNWKDERAVTRRELAEAMRAIAEGRPVSPEQLPSMGCSIKWK